MVAPSLLTPSTPSSTIQASTPSKSNTITTPPPLVTPSTSGLQGEREEAFDIFNFTLKPVWDCQTARNLFNVDKYGDIREEVRFLGSRLLRASNDNTELLALLPSGTQMKDLLELDDELKKELRCKYMYLGRLYLVALQKYGWTASQVGLHSDRGISWHECCRHTITLVKQVYDSEISPSTLQLWNRVFRIEKIILCKLPPKNNLRPPFQVNNPVEASMIAHWTRNNLDNFSVYELTEYIMDTLIMNMAKFNILIAKSLIADNGHDDYAHFERAIKEHGDELLEEEVLAEQKKILDEHRLKGIVNSTVYKWIAYLGF